MRARLLVLAVLAAACGRLMQSEECKKYIACAEAVDPTVARSVNGLYGPGGTCWATNQATADACSMVCTRDREALFADPDAGMKPECATTSP